MPGRGLLPLADNLLHLLAHRLQADPQRLKRLGRYALALMDEAKQDVLRADVVMVERSGLFLSQDHNPPRPVGEPLEHLVAPSPSGPGRQLQSCPSLPHATPRGASGQRAQLRRKRTLGSPPNAQRTTRRSATGAPRRSDAPLAHLVILRVTA